MLMRCVRRCLRSDLRRRALDVGALGAVAQRVVHQHQRQHRFGDGRGADADAGVVAAVGFHQTPAVPSRSIERRGRRMLEVGLMAMLTTTSWPVEMPPTTPPA